jgi:GPH family glycoside/pentoside/hexuronide:cation symporter
MSWTLLSGIVIGMVFNMVLLPMWLEKDINGYPVLMIIMSLIAIPLLLMEYFYTRERISEDVNLEISTEENKIPLWEQMKALFSNKYYVILIIIATISGIVDNFKGGNVQYFYIKFLLDGVNNPLMFTIYMVITGAPVGIGAFLIYPLVKKMGIKNLTVLGYAMVLVGSIMGWLFPTNIPIVFIGGFLRNMGWLPNAYIFATLMCFAFDSVEFKSHLRLEGLMGVAVVTAVQALIYAPFAGGYESTILKMGFVDIEGVIPSAEVISFMNDAFYLFDAALALVVVILLPFVDVEKKLPEINEELERRKKEAVLARGEEWLEPEEQEKRDAEKAAALREENRIADLRAKCERRGLNFEKENAKYLAKQEKKKKPSEKYTVVYK